MGQRTELEGCVLGVVWDRGPCTAYTIRRVFQNSPSPHWTGSAGAIYPLLARLRRQGLIRAKPHHAGHRPAKLYQLTPSGRRALRRWLGPPLPEWAVGVPVDPLRTRLRFLLAAVPAARLAFLKEADRKLHEHIRTVRADRRRRRHAGDAFAYLVAEGALKMLNARLSWLREVADEVKRQDRTRAARERLRRSGSSASARSR